jgi:hypothetical protein
MATGLAHVELLVYPALSCLRLEMSALGQKQTFKRLRLMSALPPKADIGTQLRNALCAKSGQSALQKNRSYSITSLTRARRSGIAAVGRRGDVN